jgi:hypothetical protein
MNDPTWYILLGVLVSAVLLWMIWKLLSWMKLLRRGVLVEGRIETHKRHFNEYGDERGATYLSLVYSYTCSATNYDHEEVVGPHTYYKLKDGDSVKVRCLLEDPTTAELEASAFITLLRRIMTIWGMYLDSNETFPGKWKGD